MAGCRSVRRQFAAVELLGRTGEHGVDFRKLLRQRIRFIRILARRVGLGVGAEHPLPFPAFFSAAGRRVAAACEDQKAVAGERPAWLVRKNMAAGMSVVAVRTIIGRIDRRTDKPRQDRNGHAILSSSAFFSNWRQSFCK